MNIVKVKELLISVFARNLIIINIALLFCLGLSAVPGIAQTLRAPVAYFAATPSKGPAPLSVQFADRSRGTVSSWTWDFGDGATSTAKNPSHSYTTAGIYTAKLTVKNSSGSSYQITSISATGSQPPPVSAPAANFSLAPSSGQAPLAVQFTNSSTGTVSSWAWDFGDGATNSNPSPSHTYTSPGTYTARLTVSNASGSSSKTASVTATSSALPTANFSAAPSSGEAPLKVQFTDTSTGTINSWAWDFGDGTTSSAQNPNHTFNNPASYTVKLTASNASGSAYKITSISALAPAPPPSSGVAYYVDAAGGSDSWPGTQAQPWKSIAKVNGSNFPAGASILFKRGSTWTEALKPPNSGTSGSPIVFGAYGTGALPVIDGQNARTPVLITKSYITVEDIEAKNSNADGVKVGPPSSANITGLLLQRLTVHNSAQEGISVSNQTSNNNYAVTGITITDCTSYDNGYAGIKGYAGVDHITVSKNKVYHNGTHPASQWGWHGISFYGPDVSHRPSYVVIEHNEVYNQLEGTNSSSKEGTGIHCDDKCDHMTLRYNYSHDNNGPGICLNTNTNVDVCYNLCTNNGTGTSPYTAGIYSINSTYVNIYNNTVYGDKNYGVYVINMDVAGTNFNIKNNIFMNNGSYELRVYTSSGSIANFVSDHNCFYNPMKSNLVQYLNLGSGNLSWWQGRGFDLQGMNQDPKFVSVTNRDFHLQSTSSCKDAGVNLSLSKDYDGETVPYGPFPDMGAFEVSP